MPAVNPFNHEPQGYVSATAEQAINPSENTEAVPIHLAIILLVAAGGLWALNKAGFRFVATVGGGVSA